MHKPHLFAYGTLMCEDIFLTVTGCHCSSTEAVLNDYRRLRIRGEEYPGITPAPGFEVSGLVCRDLSPDAWARLDRFEGDMYERREVTVMLAGGEHLPAQTYVIRDRFRDCLEPLAWSLEDFLQNGKTRFKEAFPGFARRD